MKTKFPCINCLILPICKAEIQGYFNKERHLQTGVLARLLIKCDDLDYYVHTEENEHRDLDVIIIEQLRNL